MQSATLPVSWQHAHKVAHDLHLRKPSGATVTWVNHFSIQHANWDSLRKSAFVGVDGTFLQMILRAAGIRVGRSSADLVIPQYLSLRPEARIVLLGAAPGIAQQAATRLSGSVSTFDGYDGLAQLQEDPRPLSNLNPDIVVVGLGAGLQDEVAESLQTLLPNAMIFTAGGWIDQLAAKEQYFPPAIHTLRLGWAWRIALEPKRLIRRYTIDAVRAVFLAPRLLASLNLHLKSETDLGFTGKGTAR